MEFAKCFRRGRQRREKKGMGGKQDRTPKSHQQAQPNLLRHNSSTKFGLHK